MPETFIMLKLLDENPDAQHHEPLAGTVARLVAAKTAIAVLEIALPTALAVALWGWMGIVVAAVPVSMAWARRRITRASRNHGIVPRLSRVMHEIDEVLEA